MMEVEEEEALIKEEEQEKEPFINLHFNASKLRIFLSLHACIVGAVLCISINDHK